jgi:hypothetical protein
MTSIGDKVIDLNKPLTGYVTEVKMFDLMVKWANGYTYKIDRPHGFHHRYKVISNG